MSDDPDFQKADYVLQVLRKARLSRNETAAAARTVDGGWLARFWRD